MLVVKQFHKNYFDKSNYSIFKEANNYVKDMGFDFEIVKEGSDINFRNKVDKSVYQVDETKLSTEMEKKRTEVKVSEIMESSWQGLNFITRMEDATISKNYFAWLKNWKSCPSSVIIEFFNLFYQIIMFSRNRSRPIH